LLASGFYILVLPEMIGISMCLLYNILFCCAMIEINLLKNNVVSVFSGFLLAELNHLVAA